MDMGSRVEATGGFQQRSPAPVIVAILVAATCVVVAVVAWPRAGRVTGNPVQGVRATAAQPARLGTAISWIDGLAAGAILAADVSTRLSSRNPAMAKAVGAVWMDLDASAHPAMLRRATGWIDGLAAGRILTSDIDTRLAMRNPKLAHVVTAAWADLGPVANRSV
jgi:hypothetical protein